MFFSVIRNAYSDATNQYLIVIFTVLFFQVDFIAASETFLLDYFFVSIAFRKCCDFLLKVGFYFTYRHFINLLISVFITATIYCHLYCTLANNLGFCFPCLCPTLFSASFSNAFSTSRSFSFIIHSLKSVSGQCHLFDFLCASH